MSPTFNVFLCMTLCFSTFGGYRFLLHDRGIDYIRHFLWTSLYFLSVAVVTSFIFLNYIARALSDFTPTPLIVLVIFMLCQLVIFIYIPKHFAAPAEYFKKYPDRDYLKIDWRRLVSKSMDILAQQVFIVLLVMFLRDAGPSLFHIIPAFMFLFALLHVPLIASERGAWPSWLFSGAVVVFSIIFPILILKVPYGFVYTYMIHWLFYTVTAVSFWSFRTKR